MKVKHLQRNEVALSLGPIHVVWMLRVKYEWVLPSNFLKVNVSYFGEQIKKDIAIFAISILKVESFMQNVPKLPSLDWHLKNYWHIWNQYPRICWNAKFSTKNTLFGYVWGRTWINYCRIWNLLPQIYLSA